MAETRISCPECGATLRLDGRVPAGKQLRCPKCREMFRPGDPDDEPPRRRASRDDDDRYDDDRRDRPRSRGKRRKQQKSSAAMIVAVVAISIFVLGGGAAAAYFLTPSKKTEPAVANNTPAGGGAAKGGGVAAQGFAVKGPTSPPSGTPVGLEIGNAAPEIDGEDIEGNRFKLSDYRGKVVVLDFWGDW